jgi:hypothetical protein
MFFSARQAHQTWGSVKRFMGDAYVTGRKWAGTIDGYANLARRVLGAAAPMLDDLGAGRVLSSGVRGLSEYDSVRKTVMDTDTHARGHLGRIAKAAPELF